jgi:pimeloyl-ACP methyl ester carboxylesterase
MDGEFTAGLHPARLRAARRWPGAAALHARDRIGRAASDHAGDGDERGNPFAWLSEITCPVRVATTEKSWTIYKEMAARAVGLLPAASKMTFDGIGHSVAQEAPELVLQALKAFEAQAG